MLSRRRNALTLTKHCVGAQNFILGRFAQRPQNDKNSSRKLFAHGLTFGTCLGRVPVSSGWLREAPRILPSCSWSDFGSPRTAKNALGPSWAPPGRLLDACAGIPRVAPSAPKCSKTIFPQFFVDFGLARAAFGMHFRLFRQTFRAKLR